MKILCAYSGIQFTVEHFPAYLSSRECYHPIFDIPQKKLFSYITKWTNHELTDVDSYLLFLALLNSTDQIEFRVPAERTTRTTQIVALNMDALIHIIGKINLIKHPAFVLSRIAITPETKNLSNVNIWIQNWNESFRDFQDGYKQRELDEKIIRREYALQKLIKDAQKPIAHYAKILADWAADAADFPMNAISIDSKTTSCREYWKSIIVRCCKDESIFQVPKNDIIELIDHCEDNLEMGSIYSYTLMKLLRDGIRKQSNFLGFSELDSGAPNYRILDVESTIEDANKMAMIDSAPESAPVKSSYPTLLAYLRAKAKYDMAQEYKKHLEAEGMPTLTVSGIGEI
jgi:hypothetical protein